MSYDLGSYRQQINDNSTLAKKYKKRNFAQLTEQEEFEALSDVIIANKRRGVETMMCTFTQGLVDQGLIKGEKLGIEKEKKNTIIRMLKNVKGKRKFCRKISFRICHP